MNLIETTKKFGDQESCVNYLEAARWPEGVQCLKCDSPRITRITTNETESKRKDPRTGEVKVRKVPARIVYQCYACGHQFSATTGTIFHDTHLDLEKWFLAVALMTNAKKGLSALQLKRDIKVAYKTAWYLNHRIREAMALLEAADEKPLTGTVEVDETYIGSKKYDARRKRGPYEKEPVFGMIERGGKARTYHVAKVNRQTVISKIEDHIDITADAVYTDDSPIYNKMPGNVQKHESVNHSAKEWVRGDVHTGTIDGYWGLLKRGIIGSFHQVSIKHLHRYLSEFQFRWNNRESQQMFALVIAALVIGSALPYAQLIGKATAMTPAPESSEAQ
jgi:transposase-like protein